MKIVINKESMIIATHGNDQDIKDLYNNENLEIIRIPDDVIIKDSSNEFINSSESSKANLPTDPRLSWSLEEVKENSKKVIPNIEEECRAKIISSSPGRIAAYRSKEEIAKRILESIPPDKSDLELLKSEADSKNIKVAELAKIIMEKAQNFSEVSTFIDGESHRIVGIIDNCKSYKEAWKALKDFEQTILDKILSN